MKPNIYTVLVMAIALPYATTLHAQRNNKKNAPGKLSADISTGWYNQALKNIQQLEDQIKPVQAQGCYSATNIRRRTGFYISPNGYKVQQMQQPGWEVDFQLKGIGRSAIQFTPDQSCSIAHNANQLSYSFNNIQIEYINNGDGLRQNFLAKRKMPGDGALTVTIKSVTDLQPRLLNSNSLAFFNAIDNQLLAYEDLNVWDANHKKKPAAMHFNNGLLTIEVDDDEASYPVTIPGTNYYRLKMVDNNSTYKYSNILTFSLVNALAAKVSIAPNPVVDRICVHFTGLSENTYRIELRNVLARKLQTGR